MIEIPIFPHRGRVTPRGNANLGTLREIVSADWLAGRTEAGDKGALPIACLGGVFRPLPLNAAHGRCTGNCGVLGYRNTEHVDWDKRTGLVLLDIDDVADGDLDAIRGRMADWSAVTLLWQSASRHGFKVGVAVDPLPLTPAENRDAWGTAALLAAGLLTGIPHRLDSTPAAAQAAILAHDPAALVRDSVISRLPWAVGDYRRARPNDREEQDAADGWHSVLSGCADMLEVANALNWGAGSRSTSMHRFGFEVGQRGWGENLDTARLVAEQSGLLADDGDACLNHYRRGYESGRNTLCTFFPAMGGAAW